LAGLNATGLRADAPFMAGKLAVKLFGSFSRT